METESNISLGGTKILLALFAQNLMFGQRYILSRSCDPVSHFKKALKYKKVSFFYIPRKYTPLYEKGIKENQKSRKGHKRKPK